jgi:hypothetical protein
MKYNIHRFIAVQECSIHNHVNTSTQMSPFVHSHRQLFGFYKGKESQGLGLVVLSQTKVITVEQVMGSNILFSLRLGLK